MPYPRFQGPPPAEPPRPDPTPAPAIAPDPADVPNFEALVALGVGATSAFFEKHPGHYERLRSTYFNDTARPARRPVISR